MLKWIMRGAAVLLMFAAAAASAQQFPTKPITLICPWPAGAASDLVMRAFAESVGRDLGQQVIIENRPGASGTMGAGALINARPDGYTLTQLPISVFRLPLMQKTPFDPLRTSPTSSTSPATPSAWWSGPTRRGRTWPSSSPTPRRIRT